MSKFETKMNIRTTSSDRNPKYFYAKAALDMEGTGVWLDIDGLSPMHMSIENYKHMVHAFNSLLDLREIVEEVE